MDFWIFPSEGVVLLQSSPTLNLQTFKLLGFQFEDPAQISHQFRILSIFHKQLLQLPIELGQLLTILDWVVAYLL